MKIGRKSVSTQQDNPLASFGTNEWIVEEMYQRYLNDPSSVDPAWHAAYRANREAKKRHG